MSLEDQRVAYVRLCLLNIPSPPGLEVVSRVPALLTSGSVACGDEFWWRGTFAATQARTTRTMEAPTPHRRLGVRPCLLVHYCPSSRLRRRWIAGASATVSRCCAPSFSMCWRRCPPGGPPQGSGIRWRGWRSRSWRQRLGWIRMAGSRPGRAWHR